MDTDDVCMPNRFEQQISFLCQHPEISVVGSWIKEFVGSTDNVVGIRNLPEYPDEINVFAKSRNPMKGDAINSQAQRSSFLAMAESLVFSFVLFIPMLPKT